MHRYAYEASQNCDTLEQYMDIMLHHPMWFDVFGKPIPEARRDWIIQYWQAVHRSPAEIREIAGLSVQNMSLEFYTPFRTMQDWCYGRRPCPLYTRLLIQESLGIFAKRPPRECYTGTIRPGAGAKEAEKKPKPKPKPKKRGRPLGRKNKPKENKE